MIFKREHLELILQGRKTQTRRLGKRRWVVNSIHPVKIGWYDKPTAWVRIVGLRHDRLGNMTPEDSVAEGYSTIESYRAAWEQIFKRQWDPDLYVFVIDFCLIDKPPRTQQTTLFDEEMSSDGTPSI